MKKLIVGLLAAALLLTASAQTNVQSIILSNGVPVSTNSTPKPDIKSALSGLLHAVLPNLTATDLELIVGGIFLLARLLRKAIPDKLQTGAAGSFLSHLALEINPELTPTPPGVPNPKTELKDTQTGATVIPEPVNPPKP